MDAIRQYCGTWITSEDKTPRIPLVARTWRGSSTLGRLSLEGLLVSLYSNLFTNGSFQLRGSQRGFSPSFSVFSLITHHRVILCLHLSFLTPYALYSIVDYVYLCTRK